MSVAASLGSVWYARVSSNPKARDGSASQLTALRQRGVTAGGVGAEERCFLDDGSSGATLRRPALKRLRACVADGVLDRLYVYSPDRLSRNFAHQAVLVEEFRRAGVEVVFLKR